MFPWALEVVHYFSILVIYKISSALISFTVIVTRLIKLLRTWQPLMTFLIIMGIRCCQLYFMRETISRVRNTTQKKKKKEIQLRSTCKLTQNFRSKVNLTFSIRHHYINSFSSFLFLPLRSHNNPQICSKKPKSHPWLNGTRLKLWMSVSNFLPCILQMF